MQDSEHRLHSPWASLALLSALWAVLLGLQLMKSSLQMLRREGEGIVPAGAASWQLPGADAGGLGVAGGAELHGGALAGGQGCITLRQA